MCMTASHNGACTVHIAQFLVAPCLAKGERMCATLRNMLWISGDKEGRGSS